MKVDLEKIWGLAERIVGPLGYEVVDLRYLLEQGRWVLRLLVDREGGVTIDDCRLISREIETPLEVEGLISDRYSLEVSSPGLNRPLVKEGDFIRFAGRMVWLRTREAIDGRRNYKGELKGIQGGIVEVVVDNRDYKIPYSLIQEANLVF